MIRASYIEKIDFQFKIHSVCALLGPRQVGKTTLANQYAKRFSSVHFIDLEDPFDLTSLLDNPMLTLSQLNADLIVIDEVQRRPELFPIIRVLVDKTKKKFLILGSASRDLLKQSSETLAGRIGYIELSTFSLKEVGNQSTLWLRGGFPKSYLAESDDQSYAWRQAYIQTFIERDIPNLGFSIPPAQMRRLWMMLGHNHANILNNSQIGTALSITYHTVKRYVDILAGTFMIRLLYPWFENISKRQVKSPKVYLRDSGLLNTFLSIKTNNDLIMHPTIGASWEGFAIEEIIKKYDAQEGEFFFWATQSGLELDFLLLKDGKKIGFECKYSETPKITKSMINAIQDLQLDHLYIVQPTEKTFPLHEKITVRGI